MLGDGGFPADVEGGMHSPAADELRVSAPARLPTSTSASPRALGPWPQLQTPQSLEKGNQTVPEEAGTRKTPVRLRLEEV